MRCEIIAVCPEVLKAENTDFVLWRVALRLKGLGVSLSRAVLVDANEAAAAAEIRRAVMAGTDLVIVTSRTDIEPWSAAQDGVSKATGRDLLLDPSAKKQVIERFTDKSRGKGKGMDTEAMRVLARVPVGGRVLNTDEKDVPGFVLEQGMSEILVVPSEPELSVKALDAELISVVRKRKGRGPLFEAALALPEGGIDDPIALTEDVMATLPGVYVRILPKSGGRDRLQISADLPDAEQSRKMVESAVKELKARLARLRN